MQTTKARKGAKNEAGTTWGEIYLEHRCIPQLEINGLKAISVSRREARQVLCG